MQRAQLPRRVARTLREFWLHGLGILLTVAVFEVILHVLDIPYLRADDWGSLQYRYDAELGWSPVPSSNSVSALPREIKVSHSSIGIRDVEFVRNGKPTILFIGDSLTWGYNVEASERFSDLLRERVPSHNVLNAGVSGYGTDQEYLFLKRLWNDIEPSVVVLMFCTENDRSDNSRNLRYFNYKPYLAASANGGWEFRGQPAPRPRKSRFRDNWFARHLMLVRLAVSGYVEAAYPRITVPDATEPLISMLRDEVRRRGAKLLVAVQDHDPALEAFLNNEAIPFVVLDGAEYFDSSRHWTPRGNALVAGRLATLLSANGIQVVSRGPTAGRQNP